MEIYVGKHICGEQAESVYDQMYAELFGDRKESMRNRRRADRKHKLTPKMRKQQEEMRNINICNRYIGWGWDLIDHARAESAEKVARADWEIELRNIADDDERMQIEAEIREYERKQAVEQANARAWMAMQDWLEWA